MGARVPGFLGMSGFDAADDAVYQSAVNIGLGEAAGFSALVAVSLVGGNPAGGEQMIFGNTSDGTTDGWHITRIQDATPAAASMSGYRVYLRTGGSSQVARGFQADFEDRVMLIGFTFNGSDNFSTYVNGALFSLDVTNTFVRPVGTRLRLGGSNGIVGLSNTQDTVMGSFYDSSVLTAANMATIFKAYRETGSFAGAIALAGLDIDLAYDFVGVQPALPAPATIVNSGTLGASGNLTYAGTDALTPRVVPNEMISQYQEPIA